MGLLFNIFKALGLFAGILLFLVIIVGIISAPIMKRINKRKEKELITKLQKIADECVSELKKEKNTKKSSKTKENVEK